MLRTVIDKYVLNAKSGSKLYACFIDLRKAFDTVWHDGLLLKLQKAGISGKIYNVIKSMYNSSHSRVKSKHTMSEHIEITQGVHQGRVLSPVLFDARLSLLTMTNPNQLCDVLLFVCSEMADETNLSSKLPVADRTREV